MARSKSQEALRRELAAARAELARQAEALEAQQRRDEALAHSLETAHRVIENLKTTASLWDSTKGAVPEAQTSKETAQASAKQALERQKVESLQQELTTARQAIDALKTGANQEAAQASAKQALDDERRKVEVLQQELTTARQAIDALKTGANQKTAQASARQALRAAEGRGPASRNSPRRVKPSMLSRQAQIRKPPGLPPGKRL